MRVEVVNIVATTHLGKRLDLELLSTALRDLGDASYDPDRFPGLVVRTGGRAFLVFRTGKVVVVGCKSFEEVEESIEAIVRKIGGVVGDLPHSYRIQIQNMVATVELGREIDLETLSEKLEHSLYIPEEFPGLIYKPGVGKPSALVFSTGRIVVVGATSIDDVEELVKEIEASLGGSHEAGGEG